MGNAVELPPVLISSNFKRVQSSPTLGKEEIPERVTHNGWGVIENQGKPAINRIRKLSEPLETDPLYDRKIDFATITMETINTESSGNDNKMLHIKVLHAPEKHNKTLLSTNVPIKTYSPNDSDSVEKKFGILNANAGLIQ